MSQIVYLLYQTMYVPLPNSAIAISFSIMLFLLSKEEKKK